MLRLGLLQRVSGEFHLNPHFMVGFGGVLMRPQWGGALIESDACRVGALAEDAPIPCPRLTRKP